MFKIIVGLLLLSFSMTTINSIGPDFPGVLFMDDPKDFFITELVFSIMAGIGLPVMLWGMVDLALPR